MENATEALKMAGSVLLFVLALSVIIPLFGQARLTADTVMGYSDREHDYYGSDLDEDFFFYKSDNDVDGGDVDKEDKVRTVGIETIIPMIYRSYKENTKILFTKQGGSAYNLYMYRKNGSLQEVNCIDLKYTSIPAGSEKIFIDGIVYGDFTRVPLKDSNETSTAAFKRTFNVDFLMTGGIGENQGIYDLLKDKTFKEYLGVYYQEDVTNDNPDNVPEANKDEKRVVTYELQ